MEEKFFITILQSKIDGIVNQTTAQRSTLAVCLAEYYRALAVAPTSEDYTAVTAMVYTNLGRMIENQCVESLVVTVPEDTEE